MDLDTNLTQQLEALTAWMRREVVDPAEKSKSVEVMREFNEAMLEHADFIDRYVTPKVTRLLKGEKLSVRIAEFVPPSRADLEVTASDPVESTSVPFLAQYGKEREPARNGDVR